MSKKRAPAKNQKTARNEQIAAEWEAGSTMVDIAAKHDIHPNTVREKLLRFFEQVKEPTSESEDAFQWRMTIHRLKGTNSTDGLYNRMTYRQIFRENKLIDMSCRNQQLDDDYGRFNHRPRVVDGIEPRLREIEARLSQATSGPIFVDEKGRLILDIQGHHYQVGEAFNAGDAELWSQCSSDLQWLVGKIRMLSGSMK